MGRKPVALAREIGVKDVVQLLERASARRAAMRRQGNLKQSQAPPPLSLQERETLARAAEDALMAELEAEEAEAAAKKKAKKGSKKKKSTKKGKGGGAEEAAAVASMTAAMKCVKVEDGEGGRKKG